MDIETLEKIIAYAREALVERRRLERLHTQQIARIASGAMTRARTTSYNAAASHAAERAQSFESDLKRLVLREK